jgi:hypothetical protein
MRVVFNFAPVRDDAKRRYDAEASDQAKAEECAEGNSDLDLLLGTRKVDLQFDATRSHEVTAAAGAQALMIFRLVRGLAKPYIPLSS